MGYTGRRNTRRYSIHISEQDLIQTMQRNNHKSNNLRYILQSQNWIKLLTPLHMHHYKEQIFQRCIWKVQCILPLPMDEMEAYYGPSIAYYFAFMGFLVRWLAILGILGCIVFLCRIHRNDSISTDEYTPFYGLFCFLWGVVLLRMWEQEEKSLAYRWGTLPLTDCSNYVSATDF